MLKVSLNKQKPMQKKQKIVPVMALRASGKLIALSITTLVVVAGSLTGVKIASAQSLQEQINALSQENANNQNAVSQLKDQAASYQDAINQLQNQIGGLQTQIDANTKQQETLQKKIEEAEAELAKQKDLLGKNIRAMYVEGDISTLEMLASSNDLSEFVDKQQYRESVKDKITETLTKINDLKHQLKGQKEQVDSLIKEQENQRAQLAASQREQNNLLSYNQGQQAEFNQKTKANQAKITELVRQQAIENARLFGSGGGQVGGGGYPWGNAPCLSTGQVKGWCPDYEWGYNGSYMNWQTGGYAYRNCTDWVSFRIRSSGRHVPGGLGNANQWDDRAPGFGYQVSGTPRVGAAAVSNSGFYGHVMYVESVNGDGSILVSDYNRAGPGEYGLNTLSAGTASSLRYVYF